MVDFFGSSHFKIPATNGNSEKVVPFSRLELSEWKTFTIYKFLEFRTTVKPLLSGHLWDLPKCPLNRGCQLNRGCKNRAINVC